MLVLICVKHWKYRVANIARNVAALSARHLLKTFHLLAIIIIVAVFFLIITVFTKIMSRHDSSPDFHTNHHHDQDDRPGHRSLEGCHGTFAAQLGRTPANHQAIFIINFDDDDDDDDGGKSDLLGHILANLSWHLVANVTRHLGANLEIDFVNIRFVQFQENIGKNWKNIGKILEKYRTSLATCLGTFSQPSRET